MKTGYHAIYEKNYYDAIDSAKKNGFEFVQIDLGIPKFFLDNLNDKELEHIKTYAEHQNIELSFHAPGDNVSLFCDYPKIRQGNMDQFLFIVDKANKLNARHITFHTGQYPEFKKSGCTNDEYSSIYEEYYIDILCENINILLNNTQNTLICIENSGFNSLIMKGLNELLHQKNDLFLTFDTAKTYSKNLKLLDKVYNFMIKNQSRVREIHIHDFNPNYGKHQVIGSGIVDFKLFKNFLFKEDIYMNFEIRPIEAAKISKEKLIELFQIHEY